MFTIQKTEILPVEGYLADEFKFDVRISISIDNGKSFFYCGNGKYFKESEQKKAKEYAEWNSGNFKTTSDHTVWKIIDNEKAKELWKKNNICLFNIYDDDTEGMIESDDDLEEAFKCDILIGVEYH